MNTFKRTKIWVYDTDNDIWHIAQRIDDDNNDDYGYDVKVDTWCDESIAVSIDEIEICKKPNKNTCKKPMATNNICPDCVAETGI